MAHALFDETVSVLGRLIGFPTVSADSNLDLIAYAAEHLEACGARVRITKDEGGGKANLFATIGPETAGGVVLSGHSDVVPVEGQAWSHDPFAMTERGGKLYGRGACDMKGFIAAALAFAPRYAKAALRKPLHFAFTYDEEVGCLGAQVMLADLAAQGLRPSICIVGEPTTMCIIEGHKGCCEYTTTFTGVEGHASRPELGANAIEYAVRYIGRLMEIGEALKARVPADSAFTPPWTTVQVGRINGGVARNTIAGKCAVEWEFRPVNDGDFRFVKSTIHDYVETELLPLMRAASPHADVVTEIIGEVAGLVPMHPNEAEALVRALTSDRQPAQLVSFGTEAGLFQQHGVSTVICGPGSIEQAHKPDEFIEIAQLDACLEMIGRLEEHLA
ncbi:MAG TPA: acetylornithine deacetylase [Devosia sp.]|nr:acetylornithine deacetylase [Devosia sp.]